MWKSDRRMRRSEGSKANKGVLTNVGMKLTGHKTVAVFTHYVHTEDQPVRNATELVASRYLLRVLLLISPDLAHHALAERLLSLRSPRFP